MLFFVAFSAIISSKSHQLISSTAYPLTSSAAYLLNGSNQSFLNKTLNFDDDITISRECISKEW